MKNKKFTKPFMKRVVKEIEGVKALATKEEIGNLNTDTLNPSFYTTCIYGQMTGNCYTDRAQYLIKQCCGVLYEANGHKRLVAHSFKSSFLDRGQVRINPRGRFRYSALENYIMSAKPEEVVKIVEYLKGLSKVLDLSNLYKS